MTETQLTDDARGATRGDGTRRRLLAAGLRLFATHGYEGVSTRALAAEAGANLAAINYHFGGKRALYLAVADDIAGHLRDIAGPARQHLPRALETAGDDRAALARAARGFVTALVGGMIGETADRARVGFVMREDAQPGPGFPVLYERAIEPLHQAMAALVGAARGQPAEAPESILEAHALIGQVIAFAIARPVICRRLDWDDYTPARGAQIADTVATMTLGALGLADAA